MFSIFLQIWNIIINNDVFIGGLWLSITSGLIGLITVYGRRLWNFIYSRLIVQVSMKKTDESFEWVLYYLSKKKMLFSSKNLSLKFKKTKNNTAQNSKLLEKPDIELYPGIGDHVFVFKKRLFILYRAKSKMLNSGWDNQPFQDETLHITTYGKEKHLQNFIIAARDLFLKKDQNQTAIYVMHQWGYKWVKALSKTPRKPETVILDKQIEKLILKDCENFLDRKLWYQKRAIPYRRGYLLEGAPGCGKTSFVQVLAGHMGLNICLLTLSSDNINDNSLIQRLHEVPINSIILLEDVDAVFVKRDSRSSSMNVTFSGLLNALDGVASQEGRILFMTTNHIEKLDPALIRPGRCDVIVHFTLATKDQMERLFLQFFPKHQTLAKKFCESLPEKRVSMAQLQGHFLKNRDSAENALATSAELLKQNAIVNSGYVGGECYINEWLARLGAEKFAGYLIDKNIFSVEDIRNETIDWKSLGMNNLFVTRISEMLKGNENMKKGFLLLTLEQTEEIFVGSFTHKTRKLVKSIEFVINDNSNDTKEEKQMSEYKENEFYREKGKLFAKKIGDQKVSFFQVLEYFLECKQRLKFYVANSHYYTKFAKYDDLDEDAQNEMYINVLIDNIEGLLAQDLGDYSYNVVELVPSKIKTKNFLFKTSRLINSVLDLKYIDLHAALRRIGLEKYYHLFKFHGALDMRLLKTITDVDLMNNMNLWDTDARKEIVGLLTGKKIEILEKFALVYHTDIEDILVEKFKVDKEKLDAVIEGFKKIIPQPSHVPIKNPNSQKYAIDCVNDRCISHLQLHKFLDEFKTPQDALDELVKDESLLIFDRKIFNKRQDEWVKIRAEESSLFRIVERLSLTKQTTDAITNSKRRNFKGIMMMQFAQFQQGFQMTDYKDTVKLLGYYLANPDILEKYAKCDEENIKNMWNDHWKAKNNPKAVELSDQFVEKVLELQKLDVVTSYNVEAYLLVEDNVKTPQDAIKNVEKIFSEKKLESFKKLGLKEDKKEDEKKDEIKKDDKNKDDQVTIEEFVKKHKLEQYLEALKKDKIDVPILKKLTDDELKKLGMKEMHILKVKAAK